jgi:hypothetical protein
MNATSWSLVMPSFHMSWAGAAGASGAAGATLATGAGASGAAALPAGASGAAGGGGGGGAAGSAGEPPQAETVSKMVANTDSRKIPMRGELQRSRVRQQPRFGNELFLPRTSRRGTPSTHEAAWRRYGYFFGTSSVRPSLATITSVPFACSATHFCERSPIASSASSVRSGSW